MYVVQIMNADNAQALTIQVQICEALSTLAEKLVGRHELPHWE
jgi:hypothetical protein